MAQGGNVGFKIGAPGGLGGALNLGGQQSGGLRLGQTLGGGQAGLNLGQGGGLQLGQQTLGGAPQLGQLSQTLGSGGIQLAQAKTSGGGGVPQLGRLGQTTSSGGVTSGGLQLGQMSQTTGGSGLQLGQAAISGGGLQLGQTTLGPGGLQLGQTAASAGGLQMGQLSAAGGGLQMGLMKLPASSGMPSATSQLTQTLTPALHLGGLAKPAAAQATPVSGLQLGQTATSGGLHLGQHTSGGLQLGQSTTTTGGLQLGQTSTPGGLQLGQYTSALKLGQTTGGGLQLGQRSGTIQLPQAQAVSTAAAATQLQLLRPQISQPPPFSTPSLGLQATSAAGLMQPVKPGASGLPGLIKPTQPSTTSVPVTGLTITTTGPQLQVPSTIGGAGKGGGRQYTYKELEGLINKWSTELQDQEKVFLQEAQQVNAWDRMLAQNGDKITELNDEVKRVKSDQQQLDSELDLINTQQQELEDVLSALEEKVLQQQPLAVSHHADVERTKTYQLVENVDSQLRRMEQDLKEIIEQMNSSNSSHDEDSPMVKVVKILNAHADSLSWIDRHTVSLSQKVEEVSKLTEQRRREQERSFRLAFDH